MKNIILAMFLIASSNTVFSQELSTKPPKIGWFLTPEISAMFLDSHVGNAFGVSFGLKFWKERIKVGIMGYGRSGPTNSAIFPTTFYNNQVYKGKTSADLRADWGTFGLMVAPTFKIKKIELDVPISFGGGVGGFYLVGDDRKTPDGDRVSVWENKLFNGEDAAFGTMTEFGVRAFFPTKIKGMQLGAGVHYTMISGWKTLVDPSGEFYNNKLRASLLINFGSY
jgi:hypothetical protein